MAPTEIVDSLGWQPLSETRAEFVLVVGKRWLRERLGLHGHGRWEAAAAAATSAAAPHPVRLSRSSCSAAKA